MQKKVIGFGTYQMTLDKTKQSVSTAIVSKYDFIDTAFKYLNESLIGEAIESSKNRHIPIQTKIWIDHFENVRKAFFQQLKVLKKEKIWSVLLHRPSVNFLESILAWEELIRLKKEGLIESIGVSNFDKDMINLLVKKTGVWPETNQIELSITNFREDRVQFCQNNNIAIQAWTPLGVSAMQNVKVQAIAKKYQVDAAQICLAFLLNFNIIPIVKSENESRILSNINAKKITLTSEEIDLLKKENIYENKASETYYYKN